MQKHGAGIIDCCLRAEISYILLLSSSNKVMTFCGIILSPSSSVFCLQFLRGEISLCAFVFHSVIPGGLLAFRWLITFLFRLVCKHGNAMQHRLDGDTRLVPTF